LKWEQRSQPGCPARELCDESLGRDTSGMFLLNYYPAAPLSRPQIALGGLL